MTQLAVTTNGLAARDGPPPAFMVTAEPDRWVAVEVAVNRQSLARLSRLPRLLDLGLAWASWRDGIASPGTLTLPAEVWATMRHSDQLFYRAHSSSSPNEWIDHQFTLGDDETAAAPYVRLCDAWSIPADDPLLAEHRAELLAKAAPLPDFRRVETGRKLSALVCLHRFSPRRPSAPDSLEWIVVLASESIRPGDVQALVHRFAFESLALQASHFDESPGSLAPADTADLADLPADLPSRFSGGHVRTSDHSWFSATTALRRPRRGERASSCLVSINASSAASCRSSGDRVIRMLA